MTTPLPFVKCHGCGNDFLVFPEGAWNRCGLRTENAVQTLCCRHTGVGADGVIIWSPIENTPTGFRFRIFNRDGSEAEMSGNGLRSLAAHLFLDREPLSGEADPSVEIAVHTAAGPRRVRLLAREGQSCRLRLDLGLPSFEAGQVPVRLPDGVVSTREFLLRLTEYTLNVTALSTGNPHCVVRVDAFLDAFIARVGPELEKHPAFPSRTNVEFVRVAGPHRIEVRFWERGVGPTCASGTGSAAAAAAAVANGWVSSPVQVVMEGGEFEVVQETDGRLLQEGWATRVFRGEVDPETLKVASDG